jgi:hypothetical protein
MQSIQTCKRVEKFSSIHSTSNTSKALGEKLTKNMWEELQAQKTIVH